MERDQRWEMPNFPLEIPACLAPENKCRSTVIGNIF